MNTSARSQRRVTKWLGGSLFVVLTSAAAAAWALPNVRVTGDNLAGVSHVNVSGLGNGYALRSFRFYFRHGDHKLAGIGFMPSNAGDYVDVDLRDKDGRDPYSFEAKFIHLPSMTPSKVVKKVCARAPCAIGIAPPPNASYKFVLQGFMFSRKDGESNIRQLGVRPKASGGFIEVAYADNGSFPFTATVRYAYAPSSLFARTATTSKTFGGKLGPNVLANTGDIQDTRIETRAGGSGYAIIQGFDFRFDNGDHFLKKLLLAEVTRSAGGESGGPTTFGMMLQDSNYDDPWTVTVDYAVLK